ncbi:MAG TPA: hypothetical protein VJL89_06670 [Thermodesulfovibrionia bacterium]|nr:hypothetical protein [Thermodesulfovibrionia bacterium]
MKFEIPKGTGTYADSLHAIGTASLLVEISNGKTNITDKGSFFEINCSSALSVEQWREPNPGFRYIWLKSKEDRPPGELFMDYEEEKLRAEAQKKLSEEMRKFSKKISQEQGNDNIDAPDPEYRQAAIFASMRKGWSSDKDVYRFVMKEPAEALQWIKHELFHEGKKKKTPVNVTSSQIFNPATGKSVHAAKTIAKSPSAISQEVINPFAEWMKYRGANNAMLAYRNGDDFKFFVIEPANIGVTAISELRTKLRDLNLWGGIRLDIHASLRLAELLIMRSDVMEQDGINLRGKALPKVVKGLRQAFFKNLGMGAALMNDAFLPLPDWFVLEDKEDANKFIGIIREHIGDTENGGCLNSLKEDHSDDVPILQQYRKWLTTSDINDFLYFHAIFAEHIIKKRAIKEWVREFTEKNLNIIFIRRYGLKEIVENNGFVNIARAIRNSTISSFKKPDGKWHSGFETQFGMAQEWKQKIKGGIQVFMPIISDFIVKHNWEAVHKLKKNSPPVSQDDLNDLIQLIEKHGLELVAMLLLAYGYARASKRDDEPAEQEQSEQNEKEEN